VQGHMVVSLLAVLGGMVRVVMIVAMSMRVAVHMIMRVCMVRMRSMPVAGYSGEIVRVSRLAASMAVPERPKARHGSGEEEAGQTPHGERPLPVLSPRRHWLSSSGGRPVSE
jgi:hypothetical protein